MFSPVSKGSEGIGPARGDAGAMGCVHAAREGFAADISVSRHKRKIPQGGRMWLRDPKLIFHLGPELEQSTGTV